MTAELQFWADLRKSLVCVFVLMVFITAPPFVPLVVSAGGTCFTGNVFQGLHSTKSVLSRETAPLQFTKRSKTSARWQSDFHIYQHLRFTLLLTVLTGTDVYLCGEELPGKL
jgi:hypothetical protein